MIRYMLDSSFCIDVMRDKTQSLRDKFKINSNQMAISTIVLHELYYGAANSPELDHARAKVEKFCAGVSVLDFDDSAAAHAGEIRSDLRRKGQTIGGYDTLIAGHARSLGLTVVTGNLKEFTRVDGLRCEDWLAETKEAQ
jgi:tRNA(fMet)-specific endonuclease VapC